MTLAVFTCFTALKLLYCIEKAESETSHLPPLCTVAPLRQCLCYTNTRTSNSFPSCSRYTSTTNATTMVDRPSRPSALDTSQLTLVPSQATVDVSASKVSAKLPTGESVQVLLYGAHLLSWKSRGGQHENIFMSDAAALDGSKAVRGGIPICFPVRLCSLRRPLTSSPILTMVVYLPAKRTSGPRPRTTRLRNSSSMASRVSARGSTWVSPRRRARA